MIPFISQKRLVYFDSREALENCHREILQCQGFFESRIEAYEPIKVLGEGSFGQVSLVKHRYSNKKFALKSIKKAKIVRDFNRNDQVFQEIEIM